MQTVNNLIINSILPVLFAFASAHKEEALQQKVLSWLAALPKEKNKITKAWEGEPVEHKNAFDSQALLFLEKTYCRTFQCLSCAIGHSILKRNQTTS